MNELLESGLNNYFKQYNIKHTKTYKFRIFSVNPTENKT